MDPLKRIPFQIPGGRLALGDVFRYLDPFIFCTTQFGFLRAHCETREVIVRTGIGYNNPIHPPSDIGQSVSWDQNQTVTELAVSGRWVITDNIGRTTFRPYPAALVWRNDEGLSFNGYVPQVDGFLWDRGKEAVIVGDEVYVTQQVWEGEPATWHVFSAMTLEWLRVSLVGPDAAPASSLRGFTYRWVPMDGSGQSQYELVRSDVAVEQPPAPAPAPAPPSPAPEPPAPPAEPVPPAPGGTPMPLVATFWKDSQGPVPDEFDIGYRDEPNKQTWIVPKSHRVTPTNPPPVAPLGPSIHGGFGVQSTYLVDDGRSGEGFPIYLSADYVELGFFGLGMPELNVAVAETERPGQPFVKIMDGTGPNVQWEVIVTAPDGRVWRKKKSEVTEPGGIVAWGAFAK